MYEYLMDLEKIEEIRLGLFYVTKISIRADWQLTCGNIHVTRRCPHKVGGLEVAVPVGGVAHDARGHTAVQSIHRGVSRWHIWWSTVQQ